MAFFWNIKSTFTNITLRPQSVIISHKKRRVIQGHLVNKLRPEVAAACANLSVSVCTESLKLRRDLNSRMFPLRFDNWHWPALFNWLCIHSFDVVFVISRRIFSIDELHPVFVPAWRGGAMLILPKILKQLMTQIDIDRRLDGTDHDPQNVFCWDSTSVHRVMPTYVY